MRKPKVMPSIMNILQSNTLFNSESSDKQNFKHSVLLDIKRKNKIVQISDEHTLRNRKEQERMDEIGNYKKVMMNGD